MGTVPAFTLAFALAAAAAPGSAGAQPLPDRELAVANHARLAINELYASPTASESWGEDRLGEQMLPPTRTVHLKLGRGRECDYDLQAVYEDASREELHGVNVCKTHAVAFDGAAAVPAPAVTALHEVTIANRSPRPIQQVLISPSDAGDWGDDRLGNTSISVGDTATLRYRGGCLADLRVVFDNRAAEERRGVDLCSARRVAIQPGWTTADVVPTELQPGAQMVLLHVTNRTGRGVSGLFLYPSGSADRGPDLLGGSTLDDSAQLSINYQRPADSCAFTAHVVFGGKLPDQDLAGFDLCRSLDMSLAARQ